MRKFKRVDWLEDQLEACSYRCQAAEARVEYLERVAKDLSSLTQMYWSGVSDCNHYGYKNCTNATKDEALNEIL
jgi:hypothetical protein